MSLGSAVHKAFGRFEPAAIRVYRGAFIDLDELATTIASVAPSAKRVLEIGCGDGAMAAALCRSLPDAHLLGLDPAAKAPGRQFDGEPGRAEFRRIATTELISEGSGGFDLVMLCDVVHHVAESERGQVLLDAAALTSPGGTVVVKEWEHRAGMSTAFAYGADRWVSGDATVRFMPRTELDGLIEAAMPGWPVTCEARIPPRRANLLLTLRRPEN